VVTQMGWFSDNKEDEDTAPFENYPAF